MRLLPRKPWDPFHAALAASAALATMDAQGTDQGNSRSKATSGASLGPNSGVPAASRAESNALHPIEGLGSLQFIRGTLALTFEKNLALAAEPEYSAYVLPTGETIFDLSFPGTAAKKGGTLELSDPEFSKITVGQGIDNEIQIRLYGRRNSGDLRKKVQFVRRPDGLSLLPVSVAPVASGSEFMEHGEAPSGQKFIPPLEAPESTFSSARDTPRGLDVLGESSSSQESSGVPVTSIGSQEAVALSKDLPKDLSKDLRENQGASQLSTVNPPGAGIDQDPVPAVPTPASQAGTAPLFVGEENATGPEHFSLGQVMSVIAMTVAALSLGGYTFVRLRGRGRTALTRGEKLLEVVSTLPLGPKRHLLLVRVRGTEIALASTEHGIAFLSSIGQPERIADDRERAYAPRARALEAEAPSLARPVAPPARASGPTRAEGTSAEDGRKKSEILLQALKKMKEKSPETQDPGSERTGGERTTSARKPTTEPPESGSAKSQKVPFAKYLSSAFENESKREIVKSREPEDNVESVTNLIREKLKGMQQLD